MAGRQSYSIVEYYAEREGYQCGYCKKPNTNFSHGKRRNTAIDALLHLRRASDVLTSRHFDKQATYVLSSKTLKNKPKHWSKFKFYFNNSSLIA